MATISELFDGAVRCQQSGFLRRAVQLCGQVLQTDPAQAAANQLLGTLAIEAGGDSAASSLRDMLAMVYFNVGNARANKGQWPESALCFRESLRFRPHHAQTHNNLGNAFHAQGCLEAAAQCFRQALVRDCRYATAHYNLANTYAEQGQLSEAVGRYLQAINWNSFLAEPHINLGNALMHLGLRQEAEEHYEEALRIKPGHPTALWQRSWLRLLEGDYEGGWRDYEQRWSALNMSPRSFREPRWDGSYLEGRTILVYAEQGLGDTLQFVRYLPLVKDRCGTLIFECQRALIELCAHVGPVDQLVAEGDPLPSFDVQVPLLSLPGIFGTTPATIPASVPYLRADAGLVERWGRELARLDGFKIGIVWQGNPANKLDRYRSIPLASFEPLARVDGASLLSLQVGAGMEQLASAPFPVTNLGSRFDSTSLKDLAGVLMNLDLVITIETAVAHLAGALGLPVWALLTVTPAWRWLLERADSPWYPTMRLFRQRRLGDWREVIERVAAELRQLRKKSTLETVDPKL